MTRTTPELAMLRVARPRLPLGFRNSPLSNRWASVLAIVALLMAVAGGVAAASAHAGTDEISDGFVGPFPGVSGPYYRDLTRVFVHNDDNPNGAIGACENASDSDGDYVATGPARTLAMRPWMDTKTTSGRALIGGAAMASTTCSTSRERWRLTHA
jgi:hypothetical protein